MSQTVKNLPAMQETQGQSLSWEDPHRRKWQPTPAFLPGESHGQRSLAGYTPWCCKESDRVTNTFPFFHEGPVEDSGVRSLFSGTSCSEICSAGFLILRSTGNTPVTHNPSPCLGHISPCPGRCPGAHTLSAATRHSKEVAEETVGP